MRSRIIVSILLAAVLTACIDPLDPAIRNDTEVLLIEGEMVDQSGRSLVEIVRWVPDEGHYRSRPQSGMTVVSVAADDGAEVLWSEQETGQYRPPADYALAIGSTHYLRVTTPEGTVVESRPETVPAPVPIADVAVVFEAESYFRPAISRFIPAFKYYIDINDPPGETNFYRASYQKWETVNICASCEFGRYRNGECIPDARNQGTWEYYCDTTCYQITEGDDEAIISDEFSDGGRISGLQVARIDHTRQTGGLLFEARLQSISKARHAYQSLVINLSREGGNLNATIPAPLVGNLRVINTETDTEGTTILGFVGVASESGQRLFLRREDVDGQPLPDRTVNQEEPGVPNCDVIPLGCPPLTPCEGPNRTDIQPAGWGQ